jgi:hypothetical protein
MTLPLDDAHLFALLGACLVASGLAALASSSVREFVRDHEPKLVSRFSFAPRRPFLSLQTGPDRDRGEEQLFRWLRAGGAIELTEKYPRFSSRWKRYQLARLASIVLICLWLVAFMLRIVEGGSIAG